MSVGGGEVVEHPFDTDRVCPDRKSVGFATRQLIG
jgi:hypothetical protein